MPKTKNSITLSPKHGVNPAIPKCYFCGEDKNEILLLGRLPGDEEAPHGAVFDHRPCDKCAELMRQGVMFISVRDGERGDNPYRTGKLCVIREGAISRMGINSPELVQSILKARVCFLEDTSWAALGLPSGDSDDTETSSTEDRVHAGSLPGTDPEGDPESEGGA